MLEKQKPVATSEQEYFPVNEYVCRKEDMSPSGRLQMIKDQDGDIHIMVLEGNHQGDIKNSAGIEFCTAFIGGGGSPETFKALNALMIAMQKDNDNPRSRARRFSFDDQPAP